MNEIEKIEQTIADFVVGGDESDLKKLDEVLHADFRVTNNGFMGTKGITVISKKDYLDKIKIGVFGGKPRTMKIEDIDCNTSIASVKLRIESDENSFISYNSLVLDVDNKWKIINNLAIVKPKK